MSRRLLDHYGVTTPLVSFHSYSDEAVAEQLLARLASGEDLALISDAGTPLVSDPGRELVARAIERGIEVVPIPGPSALLAALVGSGLPADRFAFLGFLPRQEGEQREVLAKWKDAPGALVLYEAPSRVPETLHVLERVLGDRAACVARELTKKFETFVRGRLSELAGRFEAEEARGEIVIIIAPPEPDIAPAPEAIDREIDRLLDAETSVGDAAKLIAGGFGIARQDAYKRVLARRASRRNAP